MDTSVLLEQDATFLSEKEYAYDLFPQGGELHIIIKDFQFPADKAEIKPTLIKFRKFVAKNKNLKRIKGEVKKLCAKFPLYRNLK